MKVERGKLEESSVFFFFGADEAGVLEDGAEGGFVAERDFFGAAAGGVRVAGGRERGVAEAVGESGELGADGARGGVGVDGAERLVGEGRTAGDPDGPQRNRDPDFGRDPVDVVRGGVAEARGERVEERPRGVAADGGVFDRGRGGGFGARGESSLP